MLSTRKHCTAFVNVVPFRALLPPLHRLTTGAPTFNNIDHTASSRTLFNQRVISTESTKSTPKHKTKTKARLEPREQRPRRHGPKGELSAVGYMKPTIQWYPGHIAKAERALKESIKMVDVVIEVRDCRIPIATAHPHVSQWVANKTRLLAMNRADLAPECARSTWRQYLLDQGEKVRFINAKQGRGIKELKKLAVDAGSSINEKRKAKGLLPRPVRCLVIGYPNVGKSAIINRLVGKNAAKSANKPGVTRNFQWVRISDSIELLDMPGIIPAKLVSQDTALRLAICDDIGQAAYDAQVVAALMVEELKRVSSQFPGFFDLTPMKDRFKVDPSSCTGEDFVHSAADKLCKGDVERTAVRLLTEFRSGVLGLAALEAPEMLRELAEDSITKRD